MFQAQHVQLNPKVQHYTLWKSETALTHNEVLKLWQSDRTFRQFWIGLLKVAPFQTYRWETPCITQSSLHRPFEFILFDAPSLHRRADPHTFAGYFQDPSNGVVTFPSLQKDALLIVPTPQTEPSAYVHLAVFTRNAPETQQHNLWQTVANSVTQTLGDRPLWLNTAGGGVAWLHVRLDQRPKYYHYRPYKQMQGISPSSLPLPKTE